MQKEQAFMNLIDSELPMLRRVVWQIMRNTVDTDEVIQEALLLAWQNFAKFREKAKFSTWVYRIAVNTAYTFKRKRYKEYNAMLEMAHASSDVNDVSEEHTRILQSLELALADLPPIYRQAIVLTLIDDLSGEHAAQIAGCSTNTLYWRVSEGKKLLKKALREVYHD